MRAGEFPLVKTFTWEASAWPARRIVGGAVVKNPSQRLAQILRDTLRRAELSADINPDDRALLKLRRTLLLRIAALEEDAAGSEADPAEEHRPLRAA
jgi:hypothetical protein